LILVASPAHAVVSSGTYARILFSATNVTASAYVTAVSSFSKAIKGIEVFNSGINPVVLAVGAASSEVDQIVIPGGGSAAYTVPAVGPAAVFHPIAVSQGQRLSVKALNSTNSAGELIINAFYY
jgi:multisubunit Na+/H+ antiporter MnhC subunit